jgi:CubicO group peptidase (beta-lactamase class C family)
MKANVRFVSMKFSSRLIIALTTAVFCSYGCQVGRMIIYNFADIDDYKIFPEHNIESSGHAFQFHRTEKGRFPKSLSSEDKNYTFEEYLERNKTVAFLIIQNDTIQYENYFNGYDDSSIVASFSMAQSVTSMLIGCAIEDELIQSVNEPVTNYLPDLKENGFEKVTIEHALQMTSGIKFNESYANPFGHAATFYYGTNLRKAVNKLELESEPGKNFNYVSGDTQLLGMVLESALKGKTISAYLEEKLWKPMQMEFGASWSIDREKNGVEKTFCCLNARARDFAKLGRLYLNKGNWNGKQLVPQSWVEQSTKLDYSSGAWFYQYQWWLPTKDGDFMAQGILGQYIYVHPAKNLIIVRLGSNYGKTDWYNFLPSLAKLY